jgi:replicative DNA helicase
MKTQGEHSDMSVVTMTPEKIHHEISKHISRGVPYIDALVDFAEKNNVEIETVAQIVKKSSILREKVKSEAIKLKMVQKDETDLTDLCE